MIQWLAANWSEIAIPVLALIATFAAGLWLRTIVVGACDRWRARTTWKGSRLLVKTACRPFPFWFSLLGVSIAIGVSIAPSEVKSVTWKVTGSAFILSAGWVIAALSNKLLQLYLRKIRAPQPTASLARNTVRATIFVVCVLEGLDIWGIPTTPLLLLIAGALIAAILTLRNAAPNILAAFQLWATGHVKAGDYIKLETGEEGRVVEINSHNTRIKTLDESIVIVPNSRLLQHTIIVYGDTGKIAREPLAPDSPIQSGQLPTAKADTGKVSETQSALSDRELQVARLIAEGISNREIAERLFIAENTVKVHVKNILKKLELRNRQQVATYTVMQDWAAADEAKGAELT